MRYYQKKPMHILIDSGSTHNFLDVQVVKNYGCTIEQMQPLNVVVVDGSKISIYSMVKNFKWTIQHTTFTAYMLLLPLGCCDLVLGIEWLIQLSNIIWNFDKLTMDFKVHGRRHVLRGATTNKVKIVKQHQFCKTLVDEVHLLLMQVGDETGTLLQSLTTHAHAHVVHSRLPLEIEELLDEFLDVFQEPTHLPPFRTGHDHQITSSQGVDPVNRRAYRYAKNQKDIIDKLILEYLKSGIIQNSSSPCASPVVLVGKKDRSWRLCVDYGELNEGTVKNKFLIPLVDDLLDELKGSTIFSKIDLRVQSSQNGPCKYMENSIQNTLKTL